MLNHTTRTRRRRFNRLGTALWGRTALAGIIIASSSAGFGCNGDDTTRIGEQPDGPITSPERDQNGSIRVDSAAITAVLDGQRVRARVPLEGLVSGAGHVYVSLRNVDDTEVLSSVDLDYSIGRGETRVLEANLDLPASLAQQAELVQFNLVVRAADNLRVTRSLLHVIPPYEVSVEGPQRLNAGKQASYRVFARNAVTRAPFADQTVTLTFSAEGGDTERHTLSTDETGTATLELRAPAAGAYTVAASAQAFGVPTVVDEPVEVGDPTNRVLLTTDKPIYKPGQTVHLRALSLGAADRRPNSAAPVTFEIEDGKGNKIFKKSLAADSYGIASSDFALGPILNQGTFKVRAISGDTTTEKTVEVFEYALPKFRLGIETDKPWYLPGEPVSVELDARYFFGKPVANAEVVIELGAIVVGDTPFGRVQTRTDAEGRVRATLELPDALPGLGINSGNALAYVRITTTDAAGQAVTQEHALTVAAEPVLVALVPESGQLVAGIENQLDLFVSDPLGNPLPAVPADVYLDGSPRAVVTDRFGQARVTWQPDGQSAVQVDVEIAGQVVRKDFSFAEQEGSEHLLVRTERAVYDVGEDVVVEILTTGSGAVYVDWLNGGQAVEMRTLAATDGVARFTLPLDASLIGENRIQAYVVDDTGNVVRAGRTVFGRGGSKLNIAMSSDQPQYAPGEPAQLTFTVTDETGAPAVAALGVQIVDQAVFAVVDAKPGLLQSYFELEDDFAQPSYQIQAPGGDLPNLLLEQTASNDAPTASAAQVRAAANLAALGPAPLTGLAVASWTDTVESSKALLAPFMEARKPALVSTVGEAAAAAIQNLRAAGCVASDYYCSGLQMNFGDALRARIAEQFVGYDFWGNPYEHGPAMWNEATRLVSAGPDEIAKTNDDVSFVVSFEEIALTSAIVQLDFDGAPLPQAPGLDFGEPNAGAAGSGNVADEPTDDGSGESGAPRLRQDFPETLYVNPALITDASGRASIGVDMADSITEWRVSALGHTRNGQLGGSISGVTVFQDFFVDVNFPATLTRGDEVDFPIAVYNYLDAPQDVSLELQAADWFTALGSTDLSLTLGPGEVRGVSLPVRVNSVGLQTLTVEATSAGGADAVARRVRVVPDGKAFPVALSGSLEPGSVSHTLTFPAGAVPGSEQMYLNVYPAFFAQAVSGMDSVLQVPDGCFEQTTSTTWPNVLVTEYMKATGQTTPEIQLRAESLISAGYQRLLTFEHPGGGFSWFGTQDPAPFLSVTAFGLMEFADMKAVHEIDEAMLARTQDWLVAQQQADGSWQGDQSEFFSFHTSGVRNTAFVLWALAENGYNGPAVERGLQYVKANLASGEQSERDDPYTLALVANAMVLLGDSEASALLAKLDGLKRTDGDKFSWGTSLQTNFYGGGNDADVAATALVTYALLSANAYPATSEGALGFITAAKDANGNFGSTQATTWSLKTLVLAATRGTDGAVGSLSVSVDGDAFAQVELRADQSDVMTTVDMSGLADTGSHAVELAFLGTGRVSYNLVGSHNLPWSAVPPEPTGPISIEVSYDQTQLAVDDSVTATARIENLTDTTTNMVLVTLGVPPGFEVQMGDFQQYLDSGVLSKAERTGKQLILYVSELGANQTQSFEYSLIATLPVRASDGGAEVALYYEPDQKSQAAATTLVVTAP